MIAKPTHAPASAPSVKTAPAAARSVLGLLARLPAGCLQMHLPDGASFSAGTGQPRATMQVHDWAVFGRVLRSGDIGLAEGYIAKEWDSPDLTALLTLLVANREALEAIVYGRWWGSLWHRLRHLSRYNSRRGSAKNIHAHYDLGNAFYALWLDESMSYSSAWFDGRPATPLAEAQQAKTRRALQQAGVLPGAHVLEIGCGWGALAEMAAGEFAAHVTGITLSREQLSWAQQRIQRAGLGARCELRLQDYRDLAAQHETQPFDAIVSIEMFEAVGERYWPAYFDTLWRCLKPGGRACVQTISLRDDLFERYRRSTDFIQQYIFPGGLLPSQAQFAALAQRAGFEIEQRLAFGPDYALTLRHWREAFVQRHAEVIGAGFDERFVRIWTFYLAYCEAAFACGNSDVVQYTLRRPGQAHRLASDSSAPPA